MKIEKQYFRHLKDIELLRDAQAEFNAVDADGKSPLDRLLVNYGNSHEYAIKEKAFHKANQTFSKKIDGLLAEVEDMKSLLGKKFMDSLEISG